MIPAASTAESGKSTGIPRKSSISPGVYCPVVAPATQITPSNIEPAQRTPTRHDALGNRLAVRVTIAIIIRSHPTRTQSIWKNTSLKTNQSSAMNAVVNAATIIAPFRVARGSRLRTILAR
jgi:hypothetical protein